MYKAPLGTKPMLVNLSFRVQTYDIDFASHVNNGVYMRWLEELRFEFLRVHYPLERFLAEDITPVLATSTIEFKRSISLFDAPRGEMWCTQLGRATLTLESEIAVDGNICASAKQRGMLIYRSTTKPARMPKEMIELYQQDIASLKPGQE